MAKHFPGKKSEEYRRMLGQFGVTGDLALQQVILPLDMIFVRNLQQLTIIGMYAVSQNNYLFAPSRYAAYLEAKSHASLSLYCAPIIRIF